MSSNNEMNQNHTLNKNILFNPSLSCQVWQHVTNTLYLLEQASFIYVGWSFFLGVAAKNDKNISPSPIPSCTIIPNQHNAKRPERITHAPSSPGPSDVPDQPVVSRHSSHFDRVGEAPVSRHEWRLTAVQWQNGLLGQQVVEANRSLLLCYH